MTSDPPLWDFNDDPQAPLSDQDIRRRERLKTIFLTRYAALYAFARASGTREPADAEDALQTTFHQLLKKHGELLDEAPDPAAQAAQAADLKSYLYGSIRGRMFNTVRNTVSHERLLSSSESLLDRPSLGQPDRDLEERELASQIRAALALLSRQERRVILYVRIRGMTNAATGALMGISTGTVQVYLARATQKLERALAPYLSQDVR